MDEITQKAEIVRLDKKQDPTIRYLQEIYFRFKNTNRCK